MYAIYIYSLQFLDIFSHFLTVSYILLLFFFLLPKSSWGRGACSKLTTPCTMFPLIKYSLFLQPWILDFGSSLFMFCCFFLACLKRKDEKCMLPVGDLFGWTTFNNPPDATALTRKTWSERHVSNLGRHVKRICIWALFLGRFASFPHQHLVSRSPHLTHGHTCATTKLHVGPEG